MKKQNLPSIAIAVCLLFAMTAWTNVPTVRAASIWYVAPNGNDAQSCVSVAKPCASINGAMAKAGFIAGETIQVAKGTYIGTGNQVVRLDKNVVLSGGWNTAFTAQVGISKIDGQVARRGILVDYGVTASLDRFTITYGTDKINNDGWGAGIKNFGDLTITASEISKNKAVKHTNGGYGAGIYSDGTLHLANSLITDNFAFSGGGGIYAQGTVTLDQTTLRNNTIGDANTMATHGGAAMWVNYATVTISNSTISENKILGDFEGSAIDTAHSTVTLNNSTVSNNTGPHETISVYATTLNMHNSTMSDNAPMGLYLNSGTVHLEASIVANHSTADCGMNTNVPNTFISDGYNVVENAGGCSLDATDVTGQDPLLVALADNGGRTMTRALTVSSPAVDLVPGTVCPPPTTDQRGAPRPTDGDSIGDINCDAGAFEYGATAPCDVPRKPILVLPANGSTLNKNRVLLKWNPALCADTYNVLVRLGSKGGALADQASDLMVTQYKTKRLNGQSFYWRVEACDGSVCIPSAWRKFNVTTP